MKEIASKLSALAKSPAVAAVTLRATSFAMAFIAVLPISLALLWSVSTLGAPVEVGIRQAVALTVIMLFIQAVKN